MKSYQEVHKLDSFFSLFSLFVLLYQYGSEFLAKCQAQCCINSLGFHPTLPVGRKLAMSVLFGLIQRLLGTNVKKTFL